MRLTNKKGNVLIALIIAMVFMAGLGLVIYGLFTSSTFSELLSNRNDNAYQLAKAGIRYAVQYNAENGVAALGDFLMPDNSKKFNLAQNGNLITSTGIVDQGSFLETRRVLQYTLSPGISDPRITNFTQDPNGPNGINAAISGPTGAASSITNDGTTITLGGDTSPGVSQSYGCIWYKGYKVNGNCNAGACSFNYGLRAYFEFQFPNNQNSGDGFTFAIISSLTNTSTRCGGFSKTEYPGSYTRTDGTITSVAGGELMGYAGPGNTYKSDGTDGQGLRPPKMAVEFDTYLNDSNSTPVYLAGTRNDPNLGTYGDHVALMFWGDSTLTGNTAALTYSGGGTRVFPLSSFDDNRHGAGQAGRVNGLGATGYDMEDGITRSCRIEITRPTSADTSGNCASGTYKYIINVWIENTSALSALTKSHLQDILVPYSDTVAKISTIYACFAQADHDNLANIYYGFTQGTGDNVQQVPITNTDFFFPNTASTCSYSISPTSATYNSTGGSGSVVLTATSSCYWAAQSLASWITITSSPLYGKGSGTITYSVSQNSGSARTGNINIAGLTFTVNQTSGCTYSISPTSASPPASGGSGSVAVTAGTGCPWTAVSNNTWITVNTGASGTGNGTVTYTVSANTGLARTGTITIAGLTYTVNQASGCTYSISPTSASPSASGGNGSVTVTAGATCPWTAVSNNTWITVNTGASGTGNGTVTYTVSANSGPARIGTITIAGLTYTVNQASGCTYSISPTSQSFVSGGGSSSVGVTASNSTCTWTASESLSWVSITSGASGTGNGTVTYTVLANSGPARNGTITIAGLTYTVNQASGCTYSISPTSLTVPRAAGSSSIAVTASGSCPWTAVSSTAWLTISSGASGTGSGTINYSYTQYNGATGTNRTATITVTITGLTPQVFTLTQTRP